MKRFMTFFICIFDLCLTISSPAWASCTEALTFTTEAEVMKELCITDKEIGYQVNPNLGIDYVKDVLSDVYLVEDSYLSILIFDFQTNKWGFFDKQSYFLALPQFDYIIDFYTTDKDSPIFLRTK